MAVEPVWQRTLLCLFGLLTGKNTGNFGSFMGVRVADSRVSLGCFAEKAFFPKREFAGNALEVLRNETWQQLGFP
jgi:hypothetical protein